MKREMIAILSLMLLSAPLHAASTVAAISSAKAYPNPWRADKHSNILIKFDTMPAASLVKIFTVSGRQVKELMADSMGLARWDRTNDSGDPVASGVYIYLIIDPQGNETSGKLAIIK